MTRAEQRALETYPPKFVTMKRYSGRKQSEKVDTHAPIRAIFCRAYQQGEKNTIERAVKWLKENVTFIHPRKGTKYCAINLSRFREAMEEE